jgi:DNA-binding response OmpR family regulator
MKKGKQQILIVDDEPKYVWAIRANLEDEGYKTLTAPDGHTALKLAATESPDLILLDVRMPDLSGLEVCRRIREFSTTPIIMLTALADERDKVKGLDMGADDYITKPFSAQELLARVRAVLRRVQLVEEQPLPSIFEAGNLRVNFGQQRVYVRQQEIELTSTEYRLLGELVRQAGRVLTADHLLDRVWGVGYEGNTQLVRLAVHRLRQRIEPDPRHPTYIETRPGLGYIFVQPD